MKQIEQIKELKNWIQQNIKISFKKNSVEQMIMLANKMSSYTIDIWFDIIASEKIVKNLLWNVTSLYLAGKISWIQESKTIFPILELYADMMGISLELKDNYKKKATKSLTREEETELGYRILNGDKKAEQELVLYHLSLVTFIAKRYYSDQLSKEDLIQEGYTGLIMAAQKFDVKKGYRFSSYAVWWIQKTIGIAVKAKDKTIRLPKHLFDLQKEVTRAREELIQITQHEPTLEEIAKYLNVSSKKLRQMEQAKTVRSLEESISYDKDTTWLETVPDTDLIPLEQQIIQTIQIESIQESLAVLKEIEKKVIFYRYGFADGVERTYEEVGKILGYTRQRIQQIEAKALKKIRNMKQFKQPEQFESAVIQNKNEIAEKILIPPLNELLKEYAQQEIEETLSILTEVHQRCLEIYHGNYEALIIESESLYLELEQTLIPRIKSLLEYRRHNKIKILK